MKCVIEIEGDVASCKTCGWTGPHRGFGILRSCVNDSSKHKPQTRRSKMQIVLQSILPGKALARCVKCGGIESILSTDSTQDIHHTCQNPDRDIQPVAMPSHATVAFNAAKAAARHIVSGMQSCGGEKIIERFLVCSACEMYNDVLGKCSSCGCYVNMLQYGEGPNKLAIASESCPIGKWQKETK